MNRVLTFWTFFQISQKPRQQTSNSREQIGLDQVDFFHFKKIQKINNIRAMSKIFAKPWRWAPLIRYTRKVVSEYSEGLILLFVVAMLKAEKIPSFW